MITTIEDSSIAEVKRIFDRSLRTVDSLPGPLDSLDTLNKMVRSAPAVFVFFAGGRKLPSADGPEIEGRWIFYAVTNHAGGQADRRRGDGRAIGAYDIVEQLSPALNGFEPGADSGSFELVDIQNLYSGQIDNQGLALYALTFKLSMDLSQTVDPASLDIFATFHADLDLDLTDGETDASDTVTMEQ